MSMRHNKESMMTMSISEGSEKKDRIKTGNEDID